MPSGREWRSGYRSPRVAGSSRRCSQPADRVLIAIDSPLAWPAPRLPDGAMPAAKERGSGCRRSVDLVPPSWQRVIAVCALARCGCVRYTSSIQEVCMVTRNRRFAIPHGYSRQDEKRIAERLVAEDSIEEA